MADIKYEIIQKIGVLSTSASGWAKELNLVSWSDRDPKYDLRDWSLRKQTDGQRPYTIERRVESPARFTQWDGIVGKKTIMKTIIQNSQTYRLPGALNAFQQSLYLHLINWKWAHITREPGWARDNLYDAILPEEYAGKYPMLYPAIRPALESHLQKFPFRIHKYFNHMASSQAANLNLFLPVLHSPQAAAILATIKPDIARIATDHLDKGYRIEFWDEPFGNLGDKTDVSGAIQTLPSPTITIRANSVCG